MHIFPGVMFSPNRIFGHFKLQQDPGFRKWEGVTNCNLFDVHDIERFVGIVHDQFKREGPKNIERSLLQVVQSEVARIHSWKWV